MTIAWMGGIAIVCVLLLSIAHATWRLQIAPMPSSRHARMRIVDLVAAQLHATPQGRQTIFELGSGWGGLAAGIAGTIPAPATQCVRGHERSVVPYVVSRLLRQRSPLLTFHRRDITDAVVQARSGDVLISYLCPEQMQRLSAAILARQDRDPVTLTLISLTFALPGFSPAEVHTLPNLYRDRLYRYAISGAATVVPP